MIEPVKHKSSRKKSWVTLEQIETEYPEFIRKIADILFKKEKGDRKDKNRKFAYYDKAQNYARSILEFLEDWDFISWKQYDSLMAIRPNGVYPYVYMEKVKIYGEFHYTNVAKDKLHFTVPNMQVEEVKRNIGNGSDKEMDRFYKKIFGEQPYFSENFDGYTTEYRNDGSRYFALPTGNESLYDYV